MKYLGAGVAKPLTLKSAKMAVILNAAYSKFSRCLDAISW